MKNPKQAQFLCITLAILVGISSISIDVEFDCIQDNSILLIKSNVCSDSEFRSTTHTSPDGLEHNGCCQGNSLTIDGVDHIRRLTKNQNSNLRKSFLILQEKLNLNLSFLFKSSTSRLTTFNESMAGIKLFLFFGHLLN